MKPERFLGELKRRHVLRVIGAYAIAAWVAVEVYTTIQPILWAEHEWTNRLVVVLALVGFPVTFALAWLFDITPSGVRRTAALDAAAEPQSQPSGASPAGPAARAPRMLTPRTTGFFGLGMLVAIVGIAAYAGLQPRVPSGARVDAGSIESIAVLPFVDMSAERDQEFFSDGISEELLNRLAQVPELRVPARTSSFAFKGRNEDIREIGRRLGVQAVLEGSVRRDGERLRVTAQLIDVATGYHIWSDNFDGDATNIFALQDEISNAIVEALRKRFPAPPEAGDRGTRNARALEHYYRGVERWNGRTEQDLRGALAEFRAALREDSTFALAHAALAQTFAVLPAYDLFPADSAVILGMAAAARALSYDPTLADAYAAMGQLVQNVEWDLRGAEDYYRRALGYKPSYATAHVWYAETLMLLGEYDAAATHVESALATDPLSPVSQHADALLRTMRGDTDAGLAAWRNLTRLNPDFSIGYLHHVYAALAAGRTDEALRSLQRLREAWPHRAAWYETAALALRDPTTRAAALRELRNADVSDVERAAWAVSLGDHALALDALETALRAHTDISLPFLVRHPLLTPLHRDPRFRRLVVDLEGLTGS